MASLAQAVIDGTSAAIRIVRQFLSNPAIITTPISDTGLPLPSQVVFIQATGFREIGQNQVSKMLLVNVAKGKEFKSDNIAPLPRVWEIEGFLFPAIPSITLIDQIQLEGLKNTLRAARISRQPVQFKPVTTDISSQFSTAFNVIGGKVTGTIEVAIENMEFDSDPTIQNKVPVKMTLMEMNSLNQTTNQSGVSSATPDGNLGNSAASPASNNLGNTSNVPATVGF